MNNLLKMFALKKQQMAGINYQQWMRQLNGQPLMDYTNYKTQSHSHHHIGEYDFPGERCAWKAIPVARFDDYILAGNDLRSMRYNNDWTLGDADRGAFTFRVHDCGNGFVIGLGHHTTDIFGYYVVLGDDDGESYVLKMVSPGRQFAPRYERVRGVSAEPGFQLSPDAPVDMWVTYEYGRIQVGLGSVIGQQMVLEYTDQQPAPSVQQFGFGLMGNRWSAPVRVTNVVSYRASLPAVAKHPYAQNQDNDRHYFHCFQSNLYPR